jgi:hypothetical protein
MQHDIESLLGVHHFAVHFDVIGLRWLRREIRARAAVDCHATSCDQFVTVTPRSNSRAREKPIQPHEEVQGDKDAPTSFAAGTFVRRLLEIRLRLRQSDYFRAFFPLPALLKQFDPFETLKNVPLGGDGAGAL